ncbi:helicase HerA-like domain-containing protein [Sphingobacterium bambusae]|uniref:Helicase HerA-like domain-containing protein n=1 Tax=Sphingobacterium bambusae TaxID=662858 RepID=A0ABW6BGP7_9SPHI|nr:helicase HerA-like domain-containing protein [Sphingobacterium bambusae]WPL47186.1 helicase HerA-like domain-containing protein [Sphingobacterium bambusae]
MEDIKKQFVDAITASYSPKGAAIQLGAGILQGQVLAEAKVNLALKMMNRHGLIAGATGTGKTRTLQLIAEQLSDAGVPVFMLDVKGDLSGLSQPGTTNEALLERGKLVGVPFEPTSFPVEIFSLSGKLGAPMRITIEDFGPILLSRILDLNDTQSGVLAALFKYAADQSWPLVDFADVKKLLSYLSEGPGAAAIKDDYGKISTATSGTILRKIVAVEQQGLASIFGEKEFDIEDLFERIDGRGVISLLNIADIQDQPVLYSTFLLSLLSQLFKQLPEVGDLEKPKLLFFFDEAHLLFNGASKAFLTQVEQIVRLIRSKGVGVFFCTQAATDIPESVLGQLGNRVQHALRAFTPNDAENLRKTVRTYPHSKFYEIDKILTSLGTGQALITVLNDKGIPTEVVATHLVAARAVMGPCSAETYKALINASIFTSKYQRAVNRRSASEIVDEKMEAVAAQQTARDEAAASKSKAGKDGGTRSRRQTPLEAAQTQASRALAREGVKILSKIASGILGAIFKKK